jgi:hypothetical protein
MHEHVKFLDKAIGDELGSQVRPESNIAIETAINVGKTALKSKFAFLSSFPLTDVFFSRISNVLSVVVRSNTPRADVLQLIGESIVAGASEHTRRGMTVEE